MDKLLFSTSYFEFGNLFNLHLSTTHKEKKLRVKFNARSSDSNEYK